MTDHNAGEAPSGPQLNRGALARPANEAASSPQLDRYRQVLVQVGLHELILLPRNLDWCEQANSLIEPDRGRFKLRSDRR